MSAKPSPAFDLQHYRDNHGGPLQYIFWRQMLQSICPGEQMGGRGGCAEAVGCSRGAGDALQENM